MTRGKPSPDQLDLSNELLTLPGEDNFRAEDGVDCRNYGGLYGLPELREIFAPLLNVPVDQLIAGDNASLAIMHDTLGVLPAQGHRRLVRALGPAAPVKFLCPVPGYDRHFALCEQFGIEMIPVDLGPDGPDLDEVRERVADDPAIKGIWVVPTYANPNGAVYTEEVTRALLEMPTARRGLPDLLGQRVRGAPPDRRRDPGAGHPGPGRGGRQPEPAVPVRLDLQDHLRRRRGVVLRRVGGQRRLVPAAPEQADDRAGQAQPPAARPVPAAARSGWST